MLFQCHCGESFNADLTPFEIRHAPRVCSGTCLRDLWIRPVVESKANLEALKAGAIEKGCDVQTNEELPVSRPFKSSYEKVFAQWLLLRNITFEFEPMVITLPSGRKYLPDFYLAVPGIFVETKGIWEPGAKAKFMEFDLLFPAEIFLVTKPVLTILKRDLRGKVSA